AIWIPAGLGTGNRSGHSLHPLGRQDVALFYQQVADRVGLSLPGIAEHGLPSLLGKRSHAFGMQQGVKIRLAADIGMGGAHAANSR
ncbi:MAG: hypothetical protein ACK56F_07235, partial [bacterium]